MVGAQGIQGVQGVQGIQGVRGFNGSAGATGASIVGPTGAKGDTGDTGGVIDVISNIIDGTLESFALFANQSKFNTYVVLISTDDRTDQNSDNLIGDKSGHIVTWASLDAYNFWIDFGTPAGATGAAGQDGINGTSIVGPPGRDGLNSTVPGPTGAQGAQGAQGVAGTNGTNGISPTLPQSLGTTDTPHFANVGFTSFTPTPSRLVISNTGLGLSQADLITNNGLTSFVDGTGSTITISPTQNLNVNGNVRFANMTLTSGLELTAITNALLATDSNGNVITSTFASSTGLITSASNGILTSDTSQDLRISATPAFANVTITSFSPTASVVVSTQNTKTLSQATLSGTNGITVALSGSNIAIGYTGSSSSSSTASMGYTPPLFQLRNALASVLAGTRDAYIFDAGDSLKVAFLGGDSPSGYTNARVNSPSHLVGKRLTEDGYPVNDDALIGSRHLDSPGEYNAYDPRVIYTPSWSIQVSTDNSGAGGNAFQNTVDSGAFTYTPTKPFNRVSILSLSLTSSPGIGTVLIDGVSFGTFTTQQLTQATYKTVFSGFALGIHNITLVPTPFPIYVAGIIPENTSIKQIYIHSVASAGALASSGANPTFGLSPFLTALGARYDLINMALGTNEALNGVAASTFATNLASRVALIAASGGADAHADVIYQTGPWLNPIAISASAVNQKAINLATFAAAVAQSPVVRGGSLGGAYSYSEANTAGYMGDNIHWLKAGYALFANATHATMIAGMATAAASISL